MGQVRVCRTVSAIDIWGTLIVSLLAVLALIYIDVVATIRLINMETGHELSYIVMAVSFLVAGQIACLYWIYIRNNSPRELELLQKYLNRGKIVVGDVHFPADETEDCCSCNINKGTVV